MWILISTLAVSKLKRNSRNTQCFGWTIKSQINTLVLPFQLTFTSPCILNIFANLQGRSWEQWLLQHSTFVHPSLEYVSQVWDPHISDDAKALENIQNLALMIAKKSVPINWLLFLANRRHFYCYVHFCKWYLSTLKGTPNLIKLITLTNTTIAKHS